MIEQIFIKNFKAFEKETIPIENHNILIGENDSGKSTILQALDIFFNQEKIDKNFIRDITIPVEIGILVNRKFYKKTYSPSTFKGQVTIGDISELSNLRYIYIPINSYEPSKLINQLAIAKTITNTPQEIIEQLKQISQNSIDEVISGIDEDLIIINSQNTQLIGEEGFKYEGALKFGVNENGIPIEARGSGFQKNLIYALLVGNTYENIILGIDEIENSFSINNCQNIIRELQIKLGQTIFSSHSKKVVEISNGTNIIPLYTHSITTIVELLSVLDNTDEKIYLLVEGKFDLPWYRTVINLLRKNDDYVVLPAGGENNAPILKQELELLGKTCKIIRDGDTNAVDSISKDCIELYAPLEDINELLGLSLTEIPQTKEDFFDKTVTTQNSKDTVKRILSENAINFLEENNELVEEVKIILGVD